MINIEGVLNYLDEKEISYRLVSNHCVGYVFYFLDDKIYPRRYFDDKIDPDIDFKVIYETEDCKIQEALSSRISKDWIYRIEGKDIQETFSKVEEYIIENTGKPKTK